MHVGRTTPKRRYVIGDVHGCCRTLSTLIETLAPRSSDELWFVGDFLQRGAFSADTLRTVRDLSESSAFSRVRAVIGNHDLHVIAVAHGLRDRTSTDATDVLDASDRTALVEWLCHLPFIDGDEDTLLVHAGLIPTWNVERAYESARDAEGQLRDPSQRVSFLERSDPRNNPTDPHDAAIALTRIRFCESDGTMHHTLKGPRSSSPDPERVKPWFEWPAPWQRERRVVFGHWAALGFHAGKHATGIDTGCSWGRHLTAYELSSGVVTQVPTDPRDIP